jgi:hypothetical protein
MATALEMIGIRNTGWHLNVESYQDTNAYTHDRNKTHPSTTEKKQMYIKTLSLLPDQSLCFGHLSPIFFPPIIQKEIKVIAVWRDLKEVLVSEFIDFRFRRKDVGWASKEMIPSDYEAFHIYMLNYSPTIRDIANIFLSTRALFNNKHFNCACGDERYFELNFSVFLSDTGLEELKRIATFVQSPLSDYSLKKTYRQALEAENKTKSNGVKLNFQRNELWDSISLSIFQEYGFESLNNELYSKIT